MLLYNCRLGDRLLIDTPAGPLVLTVLAASGGTAPRVKLGLVAPPEVRIDRREVHELRRQTAQEES